MYMMLRQYIVFCLVRVYLTIKIIIVISEYDNLEDTEKVEQILEGWNNIFLIVRKTHKDDM